MILIQGEVLLDGVDTFLQFKDVTGVYSVNNTGGWGDPNPERSEVALMFYAKKNVYNGDAKIVSADVSYIDYSSEYENDHQSVFQFKYDKDGWYEIYFISIPLTYDTPEEDNVRYNISSGKLEIYKDNAWVDFDLEDIEDILISEDYNYGHTEDIYQLDLIKQKNCALVNYIDCMQCTTCKCDKYFEDARKLNTYTQAIDYIFYNGNKYEAVRTLDKANKEFRCCK